jgi:hypothetical protein
MSVEDLKKYSEMCVKDENVRARAKEIGLRDADGHIAHGKSLGLEFSKEDFLALSKEASLYVKNELNEQELKKVAGGVVYTTIVLMGATVMALGALGFTTAANAPGW